MDLNFSKTFIFFLLSALAFRDASASEKNELGLFSSNLEIKLNEFANYVSKLLESFNDRHLGNSELGRMLHYEDIKPKIEETGRTGRGMKKMSMAMMPLIFQVGATSTWMLITTIMTAKSVAIGLALLVFKIAVSSAKIAAFFTALKAKHAHHHDWSWKPHHEHHGLERSFSDVGHSEHADWHSYSPEWTPNEVSPNIPEYKTIPIYKHSESEVHPYADIEYDEPKMKADRIYSLTPKE